MKFFLISLWFLLLVIFAGAQEDVKVKVDAFDFNANGELYLYEGEYIISKESGDKEKLPHGNGKLTQPVLENEKMIKKGYCLTPYSYEGQWQFGKKHGRGEEKKYVKTVSNTSLVEHYVGDYKEDFYDGSGALKTTNYNYTGEFKQGKKSGKGKIVLSNKDEYTGEWLNDVYHGQGVFINNLSGERYEGEFINGLYSKGKYFYPNGNTYDGEWNNNEPSGNGTYFWKQSGDNYVGEFKNGNPDGVGKLTKKDGTFFSGVIKDGKFTGEGTIMNYASNFILDDEILSIKGVYVGKIKDNLPNGEGEFRSNKLTANKHYAYYYKGDWKDGKKSGSGSVNIFRFIEMEGGAIIDEVKFTGSLLNDLYEGTDCSLTSHDFSYNGGFKMGKFDGFGTYSALGMIADMADVSYVGNFKNGKSEGEGKLTYYLNFIEEKTIIYQGIFKDGEIISGINEEYGPDDKLLYRYEGAFDRLRSGFGKIIFYENVSEGDWSENKVKSYEGEWKGDKPYGEGTMIYKNGKTDKGRFRGIKKIALPYPRFEVALINSSAGQDESYGNNDEVTIKLFADEKLIDTFEDFGSSDLSEDAMTLSFYSDIATKTYTIKIIDIKSIEVEKNIIIDGEIKQDWKRNYKESNGTWTMSKCSGNCN